MEEAKVHITTEHASGLDYECQLKVDWCFRLIFKETFLIQLKHERFFTIQGTYTT